LTFHELLTDHRLYGLYHVLRQRLCTMALSDLTHLLIGPVLQCGFPLSSPTVVVEPVGHGWNPVLTDMAQGVLRLHEVTVRADLVDQVQGQGLLADL
jgi:hypothetical protein